MKRGMLNTETQRHRDTASSLVFIKLCLCVSVSLCLLGLSSPGHAENEAVVIDFSYAGYGGGGVSVPSVPDVLRVRPTGRDDTTSIQAALDRIASKSIDGQGVRGAVLLERGTFHVAGSLRLRASGVVLRGSGIKLTTVVATGQSRRTLVEAGGDE